MSMFGDWAKKARKDEEMTLQEVADKLETHKGYISSIENGKVAPPSPKFIKKFAKLFSGDVTELLLMAHVDKAPVEVWAELKRRVFWR